MRSSLGIGRQRDRRLIERLARDHVVAAGQVLAVAAQIDAREDHLGAGRADVDADAHQRDMVLQPDRVLLERPVVVELEMVVVVIARAFVLVLEVVAVGMVGQAVPGGLLVVFFFILGIGHQKSLPIRWRPTACGRSPVKSCPAEGPFEGPLNMARGTGKGFRRSLEWAAPNRKFLAKDRFENAKSPAIWRPNDRFRPNGSQSPISLQPTL